jgi:hypothetical protein
MGTIYLEGWWPGKILGGQGSFGDEGQWTLGVIPTHSPKRQDRTNYSHLSGYHAGRKSELDTNMHTKGFKSKHMY